MPDIFNETLYEAEVTRRTGKTQAERRALIDAVVDRHLARWSGKPYPNDQQAPNLTSNAREQPATSNTN